MAKAAIARALLKGRGSSIDPLFKIILILLSVSDLPAQGLIAKNRINIVVVAYCSNNVETPQSHHMCSLEHNTCFCVQSVENTSSILLT